MKMRVLENEHVRLEPMTLAHVDALWAAAADRSTYDFAPVPSTHADMKTYVERAMADGSWAFAAKRNGEVVGCYRLMSFEWWGWPLGAIHVKGEPRVKGQDPPDVAEIGSVWLTKSVQRTVLNTAAALLLMQVAFDEWHVHRLVLKTDERNERSRNAITRLGGSFEGILRQHLPAADGIIRNTAMFSILPSEWPALRPVLEKRIMAGSP